MTRTNHFFAIGHDDDVQAAPSIVDAFGHDVFPVDADLRLVIVILAGEDVNGEFVLFAFLHQAAVLDRCSHGDVAFLVDLRVGEGQRRQGAHYRIESRRSTVTINKNVRGNFAQPLMCAAGAKSRLAFG